MWCRPCAGLFPVVATAFAVRPGFEGKVDNFGMLIPVPSVPAIKKISDDTFAHIAAAIDPPEIRGEKARADLTAACRMNYKDACARQALFEEPSHN